MEHDPEVRALLDELHRLERRYGGSRREDPRYKVPGEVNARIADLEGKLADLGVRARREGDRYVVES